MQENALLIYLLEPTNEPYAIAKIAGIKMCESYNRQYGRDYRSVMPTNLYGPGDNYHPENSHVVPALIRRFHDAKIKNLDNVIVWGSGKPKREFLYVDDMAEASLFVHNLDINVFKNNTSPMMARTLGTGKDISIRELAEKVKEIVGFKGNITFDKSKPDGTLKKRTDVSVLRSLGYVAPTDLKDGSAKVILIS